MSQEKKILNYLQNGNELTPLEALYFFGCLRLGARIYDLRSKGHQIENISKNVKYATYKMVN